jgi:hydrogenase maturation factor
MKSGKLDSNLLEKIILSKLTHKRPEVLVRPSIGEDCAVLDLGDELCVVSTDPITGAANDIGRLAVHISCNDLAANGAIPVGLLTTIMLPEGTTVEEVDNLIKQIHEASEELKVEVIGGHTEVTSAVNRTVISCTAIGKSPKGRIIKSGGCQIDDDVILTKGAGIEGTAILSADYSDLLSKDLGLDLVENGKRFINLISVVPEGIIAADFGVNAMHDVTEGGVIGAAWELMTASGVGMDIYVDKIPIAKETQGICQYFSIDPLGLISSGAMLISCKDGEGLVKVLEENGIKAGIIGKITNENGYLINRDQRVPLEPPKRDELYKAIDIGNQWK